MRVLAAILVVVGSALSAAAQDDPAERAISDMERLRADQMRQLHKAEVRTRVNPFSGEAIGGGPQSALTAKAKQIPAERSRSEGAPPWLVPSILGAAALLVAFVSLRPRGTQPGGSWNDRGRRAA